MKNIFEIAEFRLLVLIFLIFFGIAYVAIKIDEKYFEPSRIEKASRIGEI